jgi:hypothetical protein
MSNRQKFSAAQYRHHPPAQSRSCLACGQPLGRRRDQPGSRASARYCCSACRQAAFRRRPGGTPKPAVWAWGKVVTQTPPKAEEFQTPASPLFGSEDPRWPLDLVGGRQGRGQGRGGGLDPQLRRRIIDVELGRRGVRSLPPRRRHPLRDCRPRGIRPPASAVVAASSTAVVGLTARAAGSATRVTGTGSTPARASFPAASGVQHDLPQ